VESTNDESTKSLPIYGEVVMKIKFGLAAIFIFFFMQLAEASQLKIILRYDDFTGSSNIGVEQALFDAVKTVEGGILVGVIPFPKSTYPTSGAGEELPADLDREKIDLLRKYASEGIVEIAVHGYSHKNNARNGANSEFAGLPEVTQDLLLKTAKVSLEKAIGLDINAFVPPFNQYDSRTLTSLENNNYKLLSSGFSGPVLQNGMVSYLPGGPYPQKLKDVVLLALSKDHTDAIVISTIHPYDIVGAGGKMAGFRGESPQISIDTLIEDLRQLKHYEGVKFISVRELVQSGENLSADRLQENSKLRGSFVTLHRLLPEAFDAYPVNGLYYSYESASRMYVLQIAISVLLYGVLVLAVALVTCALLRGFRSNMKAITVLAGAISVGGIFTLFAKSFFSGFYMTSAVGLICCLGILFGLALNRWRTAP